MRTIRAASYLGMLACAGCSIICASHYRGVIHALGGTLAFLVGMSLFYSIYSYTDSVLHLERDRTKAKLKAVLGIGGTE